METKVSPGGRHSGHHERPGQEAKVFEFVPACRFLVPWAVGGRDKGEG